LAKQSKPQELTVIKGNASKKRHLIPTGKYMEATKPTRYTVQDQNDIADEFLNWYVSSNQNLFFKIFFAQKLISFSNIHDWKKSNPYFNYCYELAKMIQEERLQERLLTTTSPTGIIFLLKNLHGYRNEPKDENPTAFEVIGFEFTKYSDED